MRTRVMSLAAAVLAVMAIGVGPRGGGQAWAQDVERIAMARVRLTTDVNATNGCTRIGSVHDDSIKDLRRKIVKLGGNAGLLSFGGGEDLAVVFAEVLRCAQPPSAAPGTAPVRIPAPPPGPPPPPPPPPAPSR